MNSSERKIRLNRMLVRKLKERTGQEGPGGGSRGTAVLFL